MSRGSTEFPIREASMEDNELLTAQEMAAVLKVPVSWVYGHRELPCLRVGRYRRYEKDQVIRFLKEPRTV